MKEERKKFLFLKGRIYTREMVNATEGLEIMFLFLKGRLIHKRHLLRK
ncbi:hypothetical protein [Petrotoga sp. 8T1HF07.NaAc.6.1]